MEDFVNDLSGRRREATDELLRDIYKMTQNSVYGKTLQNSRGHVNTSVYTDEQLFAKGVCEEASVDCHVVNYGTDPEKPFLGFVDRLKGRAVELSHRPTGVAVLEHSKVYMMRFHYDVVKKFYQERRGDRDKAKLLYMDTDSLMYLIETRDVFADMLEMNVGYNAKFDLTAHKLSEHHGKELGSLKFEGVCKKGAVEAYERSQPGLNEEALRVHRVQPLMTSTYIGAQAKAYAEKHVTLDMAALDARAKEDEGHAELQRKLWRVEGGQVLGHLTPAQWRMIAALPKNETQVKKAKGVPGNVVRKDMTFEDWEKVRRGDEHEIVRSFNAFRSIGHEIRLVRLAKRALSYNNDKVHMTEDGGARPLGHWRNCRAAA